MAHHHHGHHRHIGHHGHHGHHCHHRHHHHCVRLMLSMVGGRCSTQPILDPASAQASRKQYNIAICCSTQSKPKLKALAGTLI